MCLVLRNRKVIALMMTVMHQDNGQTVSLGHKQTRKTHLTWDQAIQLLGLIINPLRTISPVGKSGNFATMETLGCRMVDMDCLWTQEHGQTW